MTLIKRIEKKKKTIGLKSGLFYFKPLLWRNTALDLHPISMLGINQLIGFLYWGSLWLLKIFRPPKALHLHVYSWTTWLCGIWLQSCETPEIPWYLKIPSWHRCDLWVYFNVHTDQAEKHALHLWSYIPRYQFFWLARPI